MSKQIGRPVTLCNIPTRGNTINVDVIFCHERANDKTVILKAFVVEDVPNGEFPAFNNYNRGIWFYPRVRVQYNTISGRVEHFWIEVNRTDGVTKELP